MAVLGNLLKTVVDLTSKVPDRAENVVETQVKELKSLLEGAKNTSFGLYYGFQNILDSDDLVTAYRNQVPVFDYHKLEEQWWGQQLKNDSITWPGMPDFFALSSGTTGKKSKHIPVTNDMLKSIRSVGMSLVRHLGNFDLPAEVFEKEILMLSSTANLNENNRGQREGEISGINVNNFPGWYDLFYRPGKEIASISDWDDRVKRIVEEAPSWDIGAIAGIPAWVQLVLKAIKQRYQLENLRELWPSLSVYSSGGVAFEPYRKNFEELVGGELVIIDTYLASEGFFGFTARPDTMAMTLAISHGMYYEFIPFDERGFDELGNVKSEPVTLGIGEVREGDEYALIISTCAGAWRYMIGDTIRFTDLDKLEFVISGRTKFYLNVAGSQLSEEKINAAIKDLSEQTGIGVDEFSVSAIRDQDGNFYHQWILAHDGQLDDEEAVERLDQHLQNANKNYRVARGKALKEVKLRSIDKDTFFDWLEKKKKKGGQIKTPKVMKEEDMLELMKFISDENL